MAQIRPHALRLHGASAGRPEEKCARHGDSARELRSLRLHAARHARHRERRRASRQGRRRDEKQIYRFTKGDSDLALRFDLTVPLAKYVALHANELTFPFRRYQIGKVYRGERAQRGRFREFYQADIDIIGDGKLDIMNEAEIPAVIYRVQRARTKTSAIRVNNRKVLNGFSLCSADGEIRRRDAHDR